MVEAVTFDFWNTLMWEKPGSLKEKRLEVWADLLAQVGARVDAVQLERAHDAAHREYVRAWTAGRQFGVEHAAEHILEHLLEHFDGDVGTRVLRAFVEGYTEAGRRAAVYPSGGVRECLGGLKRAGVRIGIICDIGLTPSPVVRQLLDRHGLLGSFDAMSFSDEVGHYKPARVIFEHALAELGSVPPECAAHVGDRRRTDVGGAIAVGMTAVRYNGVYEDEDTRAPDADIVLSELAELPLLLGVAEVNR
jgi:putative hydrolase of the HAD superfamily